MKDFLGTIQQMYGVKSEYKTHQIISAYNCFCRSQIKKIELESDLAKEVKQHGYCKVMQENHKWYGRLVRKSNKHNSDGMVLIYFGSQTDYIHKSKLQ